MHINNKHPNKSGEAYSGAEWLYNHFSIKSRGRFKYINSLPISSKDRILDIGCANGMWTSLFAEIISHKGRVLGIDKDPKSVLEASNKFKKEYLKGRLSFEVLDIEKSNIPEGYNVISMFNSLSYIRDPSRLLQYLSNYLRKENGLLIIKDSALCSDFYWPISSIVDIQSRKALRNINNKRIGNYDPNLGLKVRRMLEQCNFDIIDTRTNTYSFSYPFDYNEIQYINANMQMILELIGGRHSEFQELIDWVQSSSSNNGFFNRKCSIYTTTEYSYICKSI